MFGLQPPTNNCSSSVLWSNRKQRLSSFLFVTSASIRVFHCLLVIKQSPSISMGGENPCEANVVNYYSAPSCPQTSNGCLTISNKVFYYIYPVLLGCIRLCAQNIIVISSISQVSTVLWVHFCTLYIVNQCVHIPVKCVFCHFNGPLCHKQAISLNKLLFMTLNWLSSWTVYSREIVSKLDFPFVCK